MALELVAHGLSLAEPKTKTLWAPEAVLLVAPTGFVNECFRPERKSLPFQQKQEKRDPPPPILKTFLSEEFVFLRGRVYPPGWGAKWLRPPHPPPGSRANRHLGDVFTKMVLQTFQRTGRARICLQSLPLLLQPNKLCPCEAKRGRVRPAWPRPASSSLGSFLQPRSHTPAVSHRLSSACVLTVSPPNLCWAKHHSNHKQPSFPRPLCHSDREEAAGPRGPPDPGPLRAAHTARFSACSRQAGEHGGSLRSAGRKSCLRFPTQHEAAGRHALSEARLAKAPGPRPSSSAWWGPPL